MTIPEFLYAIGHIDCNWFLEDGAIRGICHSKLCCPITAVCLTKLEIFRDTGDCDYAGENLGLSRDGIYALVNSADLGEECDPELRVQMLEAVGLEAAKG